MNSSLFNGKSLHDYYRSVVQGGINKEIDEMSANDLAQDLIAMISSFETKYRIDVPILSDDVSMDEPVIEPNNSMAGITLHCPFSGDHRAFHLQASNHPVIMENCTVHTDHLTFGLRIEKSSPNDLQNKTKVLFNQVSGGLDILRRECAGYEKEIPAWVRSKFQQRMDQIASKNQLRQTFSGIIPIKKREESAKIIAPVKRTPLAITSQSTSAQPPNPAIEMSAYEDILSTIQSMVRVFERSPGTFHGMDEEDLRMILLVALNGLYEGMATGETFNGQGKTDILIRHEDKNIFIAECLIWSGAAVLRSKMDDQLFKYATWRDSKLAILVFNRNKNFTDVIAKMIDTAKSHPQCIRPLNFPNQSGARFQFKRADDPQKEFILTCLAFDVP